MFIVAIVVGLFSASYRPVSAQLSFANQIGSLDSLFVIVLLAILVSIPFYQLVCSVQWVFFLLMILSKSLNICLVQLLQTDHISVFGSMFLVMALIPAVGEEMYFRGMLQNTFSLHVNPHLSVLAVCCRVQCHTLSTLMRFFHDLLGAFWYLLLWVTVYGSLFLQYFINNVPLLLSFFFLTGIAGFQLDNTIGLHQPVVLFRLVVLTAVCLVFIALFSSKSWQRWSSESESEFVL